VSPAERLRLFVALDLPPEFLDPLVRWRDDTYRGRGDVRLPHAETLHVTLVFLGYQTERDVERLEQIVFVEPPLAFELQAREVRGVPPRRPRLHALDLDDAGGALGPWQSALSERLAAAGLYKPEKRPFWPHVTLARVKRPVPAAGSPPGLPGELREPFTAVRVTLYRSTLLPQGARYDVLAGQAAVSAGESSTG
jgi:RNA 2',3'-cyclic 3'-phosphodiesterase